MATHDIDPGGKFELSRRDFLKAGAAAAVAGAVGADLAVTPSRADAAEVAATYHSTCPYCSAQCGQLVDVDASGNVLDIYGDFNSPTSRGGLCAKGAGSYQLVTNVRRLGVPEHTAYVDGFDFSGTAGGDAAGVAWKRVGNGSWTPMGLDAAWQEVAEKLTTIRGTVTPGLTADSNAKAVQFLGCSHMNNEQNYLYRKIIADFGTSRVEHQARI
ncbi:MAG: twin-arginine translocation signal domain-containing protein [Actinomycetia bacterium]|nr:twin-arginine translocation signal domain-containing protein [Actinomycetes bacterium]